MFFLYQENFLGSLIKGGHKLKAFRIFMLVKRSLKKQERREPNIIFLTACMSVTPNIMLIPVRLGGRVLGVPMSIIESKRITVGVRLIFKALREKGKISANSIIDMLMESIYSKSLADEKKKEMYKEASDNRHLLKKYM
jgi:ribosomal protein S7